MERRLLSGFVSKTQGMQRLLRHAGICALATSCAAGVTRPVSTCAPPQGGPVEDDTQKHGPEDERMTYSQELYSGSHEALLQDHQSIQARKNRYVVCSSSHGCGRSPIAQPRLGLGEAQDGGNLT